MLKLQFKTTQFFVKLPVFIMSFYIVSLFIDDIQFTGPVTRLLEKTKCVKPSRSNLSHLILFYPFSNVSVMPPLIPVGGTVAACVMSS